ncbi:MAG: hypothetical protein KVP17_004905 [Porospora cf. gigantea B]|uniref:uncharacterized protein n=1 Tax=Porospora cf. gigantea B TaxID=2853592 RepID=UPI003571F28F|nr:MAG: hypothetical protein KVP17_004905 [Porospora cf. gigantea B]
MKLLETYCLRADQESLNLLLETKCLSEQVLLDFVSTDFQNRTRTRLTAKLSNKTINLKSLAAELARVGLSDEERVLLIVALWNNQAIHDTAAAISTTASPSGYLRGVAARCRGQPVDAACELVSHLSTNLADIPAVRLLASLVCKLTPEEDRECVHRVRKLHRIKATESMRNVLQLVSCAVPDELCPSSEHSTDLARCVVTLCGLRCWVSLRRRVHSLLPV